MAWHKILFFIKKSGKSLQVQKKALHLHSQLRGCKDGVVVQLVRIHACHAWGRGFESRPYRKRSSIWTPFFV